MADSSAGSVAGNDNGASPPHRLWDEHEAAAYLHVKVATLRRWRWAGKPPEFLKIGASVRYDPPVLDAYIEACRRQSTSQVVGVVP